MTKPNQFFVYGTLKRGLRYDDVWPCQPLHVNVAWTLGTLFTGPHYPAMKAGSDRVVGELWVFDPSQRENVVKSLDVLEGTTDNHVDDLYHRLVATVYDFDGQSLGKAYLYHFARDPLQHGFTRLSAADDGYVAWPPAG